MADSVTGVVVVRIDGENFDPIGGTSAAASLVARLNKGLKARCGFLNPILYGNALRRVLSGDAHAKGAGG